MLVVEGMREGIPPAAGGSASVGSTLPSDLGPKLRLDRRDPTVAAASASFLIDAGTGAPSSAGGSSDLAFIRVAAGSFLIAAFAGAAFAGAAFGAFGAFDMLDGMF